MSCVSNHIMIYPTAQIPTPHTRISQRMKHTDERNNNQPTNNKYKSLCKTSQTEIDPSRKLVLPINALINTDFPSANNSKACRNTTGISLSFDNNNPLPP